MSLTEGPSGSSTTIIAPAEVAPGEILRVVAAGRPAPVRVEVLRENARIARADRIDVRMTGATELGVFLLGIEPTADAGDYRLRGVGADGSVIFERDVRILEHEFRVEEIHLTPALTSLRRDPDPERTEQSRILTELIFSRDPDALYHSGRLAWPMPPDTRQTSLYGDMRSFIYSDGQRARTVHYGLDLAAPTGTQVTSSGRGIVRMARDRILTGKTVVIEHLPGVFSMYYHLHELHVSEDEVVDEGDPIGTVGATGLATGPHLHWEVRVGGVAVSPVALTRRPLLADLVGPDALPTEQPETPEHGPVPEEHSAP
jgi:murein DD-endopeptidase MepM/ murein hydrolase activator NlpD